MVGGSNPSCPATRIGIMEKIKEYYRQARIELDKVIFPTKEQTRTAYISVVVVVVVIALFLALVDFLMSTAITA